MKKNRAQVKQQVIDVALKLAAEEGWAGVSVRKISRLVGYSTIVIYSEFGGKENVFVAIKDYGFRKLLNHYKSLTFDSLSAEESVILMSDATVEFYLQNRELYQIMFGVIGVSGVSSECSAGSSSTLGAEFAREKLSAALEGDATSLFFNWWALIHGFISIGTTMSTEEFKGIMPYFHDSIKRFLKS